jgi:hypothetical protein
MVELDLGVGPVVVVGGEVDLGVGPVEMVGRWELDLGVGLLEVVAMWGGRSGGWTCRGGW